MSKARASFTLGLLLGILFSVGFYAYFLRDLHQSASSPTRTLKLAHALDTSHPVHQALLDMQVRLTDYSDGRLSLEIYPGGVLGSEVQSIEQLQQGALAMTKTSAAAMESFVDDMKVFGLPYLFRDESHYWKVLESDIGRELLLTSQSKNLRGLTYYDAGSRNFYSSNKLIKTPEDLAGMKIRVMNSRMAINMIEVLGGSPTPISWGELYTALAQGTVDAAENNPPSYVSNKHYEVGPFFSLDSHTRIPDILMVSQQIWQSLTLQEQSWLQQAADDSSVLQRQLWQQKTSEALEEARQHGVTIFQPDISLFRAKAQPIYNEIRNTKLAERVRRIKAVE